MRLLKDYPLIIIIKREFALYLRYRSAWIQPLLFFILVAGIFSIILGDTPHRLQNNAVGILWVGMILSLILSQESIFHTDNESGCLEMILLSPQSQLTILTLKIFIHTFAVGIPLLLMAIFIAWTFDVPYRGLKGMAATFSLGIPALSLMGAIATALTVHLKRGGILLAILVLPLMAPIVLFGSSAMEAAMAGLSILPHLAILAALLLILLMLSPLTCLFALRIGIEN